MKKNERTPEIAGLPEEVRNFILNEVEDGLARFRSADFDAHLKNRLRDASLRYEKPSTLFFRQWAPVLGIAIIALGIGLVVIRLTRAPVGPPSAERLASSLEGFPGFQSLQMAATDRGSLEGAQALPETPFLRPLSKVAAAAGTAEPESSAGTIIVPRYNLKQKIEILANERPIERALALITSKNGEV